jgi:hypothetical protein
VDGTKINTDETAAAATAYYGEIRYRTINDIAVMVYDFSRATKERDSTLKWEDMRIWKMDLRGAYALLSFLPEDVGLFAILFSDDLMGIFGFSETPATFQVVTRAITWELRHALRSQTVMCVDDIMGICFVGDLEADLARAKDICTSLLGPASVAADKIESGVRLDMIGYTISLPDNRVLISRDVTKRINLKAAQ